MGRLFTGSSDLKMSEKGRSMNFKKNYLFMGILLLVIVILAIHSSLAVREPYWFIPMLHWR